MQGRRWVSEFHYRQYGEDTSRRDPGGFSKPPGRRIRYRQVKRILLTLLLSAQPALAAEDALITCRQIEDIAQRVSCYDDFVDTRFPMESSDSEKTESGTIPDAQSLFGTNDAEAKRIVETSLAIEQIDNIVATVADVQESSTRKVVITLGNGQTWRQLDNHRLPLKAGQTVIIRKASLGSFLLEKESGSRAIRVKRID